MRHSTTQAGYARDGGWRPMQPCPACGRLVLLGRQGERLTPLLARPHQCQAEVQAAVVAADEAGEQEPGEEG